MESGSDGFCRIAFCCLGISVKNSSIAIFHTAICFWRKQIAVMADKKLHTQLSYRLLATSRSEMEISVKNHTDVLIFHTGICAGASQIPLMADANLRFASPRRENAPE